MMFYILIIMNCPDGKHYFFDKDGIMQTGTITVDDQNYELQADGSLKK